MKSVANEVSVGALHSSREAEMVGFMVQVVFKGPPINRRGALGDDLRPLNVRKVILEGQGADALRAKS